MESQNTSGNVDEDIIGRVTSVEEIIGALTRRGCLDLTPSIDLATCGSRPCAGGGFCDVYRGRLYDGTEIAIKSLRVYDRERGDGDRQKIFKRAARELYHWSKLKHPNVLSLIGLAIFRDCLSMVSGWMENGNLMSYLTRNPDANRIKLCMDVCAGLCYIHVNGMVHGDLKAVNIMVSLDDTAMIADFGNTQLKDLTLKLTNTATRAFSIRWAAPELLLKDNVPASKEADVYAYGMTVLEALTGKVPYEELSNSRIMWLVAMEKSVPPRLDNRICDSLWDILISCWAWEPSERPGITSVKDGLHALFAYSTPGSSASIRAHETAENARVFAPAQSPGCSIAHNSMAALDNDPPVRSEASVSVSPPRLLTRSSQPPTLTRSGRRIRSLFGLDQLEPSIRSSLHDNMYDVPRPAADAHDLRVFTNVTKAFEGSSRTYELENERMMAPTPDSRTVRGLFPRLLEMITTQKRKGKSKVVYDADGELLPLDGEEGELIDDKACFMEPRDSDGIDLLMMLPPALALYILSQLDLDSVIACLAVSHAWRRLASDDTVWRTLFYRQPGWFVNLPRRRAQILAAHATTAPQLAPSQSQPRSPSLLSSLSLTSSSRRASADPRPQPTSNQDQFNSTHEDSLNWPDLYKQRHRIARKWYFGAARSTKLSGHLDSVYCLELDTAADTIVTGSRDRSIKIWSVSSGELRETLVAHEGSVLCFKVDFARGFMCSGSSDRTIRVWERNSIGMWEVKAVLSGHAGGVLGLGMGDRWIVSCSQDTLVRVWDRQTLQLHCVLRGHEGPVNAVSLQGNHVVSASGDRTMILWDIEHESRVRTFSGHDKGLACVEFKGDTLISGSNDRKIKVWSASTGECVMTLPGHELLVRALAYDAVTGRLVSASYDRTIKVWELKEAREGWKFVREFRNLHDSHIFGVKFDATKIVSTSHDQKILVLDFAYDSDGLLFT